MNEVVPASVGEIVAEHALGTLHGRFARPKELRRPPVLSRPGTAILAVTAVVVLAIGAGAVVRRVKDDATLTETLIEAAAALLVAALGWLVWAVRNRRRALYLYGGGLVVTNAAAKVDWWADWREVSVHWAAAEVGKRVEHRVVTPEETLMRLRLGNRQQELSRQLRRLSAKAKVDEVKEQLAEGKSMGLGPLVVDSGGVTYEDTTLDWAKVNKISVVQGELVVKGEGDTIRVAAGEVPDLALLTMIRPE